ncbi:TMEM165/GDT1 family protein [Phormidium sp. FACHB-1136]|jgi:Ca2+/H+ antiporter, TMEM165/GDT1 family|uniref:TMEM165/GDT1 family protein n=1 Tax=Phormidium sp. FACHB-1136 TaxID=2692848 RepID=UPI00168566D9|nr:TMEM165/GDT1 family protein [Phormidium sp. FACHB-1136]MBD2427348.1 TMEM165/GDT1 family protein [Phormidium sp. FACHB-1136]
MKAQRPQALPWRSIAGFCSLWPKNAVSSSPPSTTTPHSAEQSSVPPTRAAFQRVFVSTFITIFLAELGDKTQVTTLLMSAQSETPWIVFLGAGSALIATSLIGVLLGQWLARRVSPQALDTASGAVLLGITVWLLWDITHL